MSPRLVWLLVPLLILATIYAVFTRTWLAEDEVRQEQQTALTRATEAFMEETFSDDEEEVDPELEREEESVLAQPEVRISEYSGRRLVVSGQLSTADERRALMEGIREDVATNYLIEDQVKLDYQCESLHWLGQFHRIDFAIVEDLRRFDLTLTNTAATVSGQVLGETERTRVGQHLRTALSGDISITNQIEVAAAPAAYLTVWAAPDSTVLLSGMIPEGKASGYISIAKDAFPDVRLVSDLIEDRFVSPPEWEGRVKEFLPGFLRNVHRASFSIEKGNQVEVRGLARASVMSDLQRRLRASFPASRYDLNLDLRLGVLASTESQSAGGEGNTPTNPGTTSGRPQTVAEMVDSMKIYFRSGRSRVSQLRASEKEKLDQLGRQWKKENFSRRVFVFGFTDQSGDKATNAYFSRNRCENVVSYLEKSHGINRSLFEIVGTPENHPPETGTPSELRRVEFGWAEEAVQPLIADWSAKTGSSPDRLKPIHAEDLLEKVKDIRFPSGKVTPPLRDREALAQLGSALVLEKRTDVIIIYGFSDQKGSWEANRWYTEERCKSVAQELTKVGVSPDQIVLRPVLPARPTQPQEDVADDEVLEEEGGEGEEESPKENPRRVRLVMLSKAAYDKAEQSVQETPEPTQEGGGRRSPAARRPVAHPHDGWRPERGYLAGGSGGRAASVGVSIALAQANGMVPPWEFGDWQSSDVASMRALPSSRGTARGGAARGRSRP